MASSQFDFLQVISMGSKSPVEQLDGDESGDGNQPKKGESANEQLQIQIAKTKLSWADLPEGIIESISTLLYPIELLTFRGICESWRKGASKKCRVDPHLVILNESSNYPSHMISVLQLKSFNINSSLINHGSCIGSSFGWLIMSSGSRRSCILSFLNIFTGAVIQLPPLHCTVKSPHVCLSAPPTSADCVVLLLGIWPGYNFAFCKMGDKMQWHIKFNQLDDTLDENDYLRQAVVLQGKFQCMSCYGNFVIIEDLNANDVRISGEEMPLWWADPRSKGLQFVVEAKGEILMVLAWISITDLHGVEVFRRDFATSDWVKAVSIGDRVLFVGHNCCFCVDPAEMELPRGNYIYIANCTLGGWTMFDMETKGIVNCFQGHWPSNGRKNKFWLLPTFK